MTNSTLNKYGYYRDLTTLPLNTVRLLARNLGVSNWARMNRKDLVKVLWNNYAEKSNIAERIN